MPNSIAALTTQPPSTTGSSANSAADALGPDAFLTLLTTELQNQDPTQPMDDTQSVSQLAQFSALQAQTTLSSQFASFQSNFGVMQSASLIGRQVTVNTTSDNSASTLTGTVSSISVQNGAPYFTMNDSSGKPVVDNNNQPLLFSTTQIVGIGS
jgi:flagellar basal-body rod modification protein FlgD